MHPPNFLQKVEQLKICRSDGVVYSMDEPNFWEEWNQHDEIEKDEARVDVDGVRFEISQELPIFVESFQ